MCMHKPVCAVTSGLVVVGGLNWGLVGLGNLLDKDLNLVKMLLGKWPMAENIVYILVGLAALAMGAMFVMKGKECPCNGDCKK